MKSIDLNCDLGEGFGAWEMGNDAAMIELATSVNVACGFHAGDADIMRKTVELAKARGVNVGAHPGYRDLHGFGRRPIPGLKSSEIENLVAYQIGALQAIATAAGHKVTHVKAHGALSNVACEDDMTANAIADGIKAVDPNLIFVVLANSKLVKAGEAANLPMVHEVFADRAYEDNGSLVSRKKPGAVLHDAKDGRVHVPLQSFPQSRAAFEIHNSPLTENAVVGFEYGYNIQEPSRLVIWEAQYGDFINGAQTMIDEFIVSARAKWGQTPSLVLLLPHGNEGQGPEHTSARPERFLQLAAQDNIQVAQPSTAGNYFHLLRRQALRTWRKPLIVMTPKSLLRRKESTSALEELTGGFQCIIGDPAKPSPKKVKRIVFCSGKVYFDIAAERDKRGVERSARERSEGTGETALARVLQS